MLVIAGIAPSGAVATGHGTLVVQIGVDRPDGTPIQDVAPDATLIASNPDTGVIHVQISDLDAADLPMVVVLDETEWAPGDTMRLTFFSGLFDDGFVIRNDEIVLEPGLSAHDVLLKRWPAQVTWTALPDPDPVMIEPSYVQATMEWWDGGGIASDVRLTTHWDSPAPLVDRGAFTHGTSGEDGTVTVQVPSAGQILTGSSAVHTWAPGTYSLTLSAELEPWQFVWLRGERTSFDVLVGG